MLKNGCKLFTEWGWTSGNPVINFKVVKCPRAYKKIIEDAFDAKGITNIEEEREKEEKEKKN